MTINNGKPLIIVRSGVVFHAFTVFFCRRDVFAGAFHARFGSRFI